MKKVLAVLVALTVCVSCFCLSGCANRSEQLKMYIPGEYIDEEIFEEFEEWYKEQTGKTVKVVKPNTFDAVEEIIPAVEEEHADYDLLLPSDYAVEYLIKHDLLIKVDKQRVDVEKLIKKEYVDLAKVSDPTLEYSVPYMYGTFGIMYDYSRTEEHINSWSAIFGDKYKDKCANKDSMREALTSAAIWANRDALFKAATETDDLDINNPADWSYGDEYHELLQKSIYDDTSEAAITKAINTLKSAQSKWPTWAGEQMKFDMAAKQGDIIVALAWSCDAGYVMNDYEDDNGKEYEGNRNIWYTVPIEGGNIYLDNFVISKYAKNVDAAQYFLEFICKKEIAMKNSEYAGAISPVNEAYVQLQSDYQTELDSDPEYIDESAEWKKMYMDMLFPPEDVLARCGTMRDYGNTAENNYADSRISKAWNDLRFS